MAFLAFWQFPANPAFAGEASRWAAVSNKICGSAAQKPGGFPAQRGWQHRLVGQRFVARPAPEQKSQVGCETSLPAKMRTRSPDYLLRNHCPPVMPGGESAL